MTVGAQRPHVLIVEDDAAVAGLAAIVLGRAGYDTTCVSTAESALAAVQQAAPSVILLDLNLGQGMCGGAFLEIYRHTPGPQAQVLLFTVLGPDAGNDVLAASDGLVSKPFDRQTLLRQVRLAVEAGARN